MAKRRKKEKQQGKLGISMIILFLLCVFVIGGGKLWAKGEYYKQQEYALAQKIKEEENRSKELESLTEYVGTDEYIEQVAKDKLGLANPNETIFKAEEP